MLTGEDTASIVGGTAGGKPRHRRLARNTRPAPEQVARALTWGADEKVLLVSAAAGWVASRGRGEALRRTGDTIDAVRAINDFAEKRRPVFTGE